MTDNGVDRTQEVAVVDANGHVTGVASVPTQVRTISMSPLGTNGTQVAASQAVELGALLGAMGLEKGAVASLLEDLQRVTMSTHLQALPLILERLRDANKTRISRLIQMVQLLPEMATVNQSAWSKITTAPGSLTSTVARQAVLDLLNAAMNEPLNRP